ncbi:hypothetical protein BDN71DRAFT_1388705 [Pleurotus eryngii]|uniref:Uncharacterized protein n=1 Tax=Pleurotus eryngii TaxID=5323 RepID=A0A9P6A3Y1_PLEER|nr:hypothetical protein BDN71DRAFT_1388705 [Pleurotus eryngii]
MCTAELIGDYYRGCQHFVGLYYTGERTDCNSPKCGVSAAHRHTAPNCPCPKQDQDERKVRNMFQVSCDACRAAAFERLSSGRG